MRNPSKSALFSVKGLFFEGGIVFSLFVLYLLMTWPLCLHLGTGAFGAAFGDPGLYLYLLEALSREFFTLPSSGFTLPFFHPFGQTLAFSDNYLLPAFFGKALIGFGLSIVTAHNVLLVSAWICNGYVTYRLGRWFGLRADAAYLSGVLFMFSSFLSSQNFHPQLNYAFWLPACLWAVLAAYREKALLAPVLVGFCIVGAFLTSAYYALFCVAIMGIVSLCELLCQDRKSGFRRALRVALLNIPCAVLLYFISEPYREVKEVFGKWPIIAFKQYSATWSSLISTDKRNWLWGKVLSEFGHYESRLFPGLLCSLLFIIAVAWSFSVCLRLTKRHGFKGRSLLFASVLSLGVILLSSCAFLFFGSQVREQVNLNAWLTALPLWSMLLVTLIFLWVLEQGGGVLRVRYVLILCAVFVSFFFLSLGIVGGHWNEAARPGAFSVLKSLVSGFGALRAIGRFGVVASLSCALLAGFGYTLIRERYFTTQMRSVGLFVFCLLFSCIELRHVNVPFQQDLAEPGVYRYLDKLPGKEAVIVLPIYDLDRDKLFGISQTHAMRSLASTGRPIVNGLSGKMPQYQTHVLYKKTYGFPDRRSVHFLGRIVDLRYIVYDRSFYPELDKEQFEAKAKLVSGELRVLHKDNKGNYLFSIDPVLSLSGLELYLRPSPGKPRTLGVEMRLKPDSAVEEPVGIHVNTGFYVDAKKNRVPALERFELKEPGQWTDASLSLPPTQNSVKPHKIRFSVEKPGTEALVELRLFRKSVD